MITVVLQDLTGKRIGDGVDVAWPMLPAETDSRFACLRFVDPYGDTVFNGIQAQYLEADLKLLIRESRNQEEVAIIEQLLSLASACQDHPHLYVRFIGD